MNIINPVFLFISFINFQSKICGIFSSGKIVKIRGGRKKMKTSKEDKLNYPVVFISTFV